MEDYLETILIIEKKLPAVRSVDVANEMEFKKSSVSVAMKHLYERGFITVNPVGRYIELTDSGRSIAEKIYERHNLLTKWFVELGVDKEVAVEDACRIEHEISNQSFEALKEFFTKNGL